MQPTGREALIGRLFLRAFLGTCPAPVLRTKAAVTTRAHLRPHACEKGQTPKTDHWPSRICATLSCLGGRNSLCYHDTYFPRLLTVALRFLYHLVFCTTGLPLTACGGVCNDKSAPPGWDGQTVVRLIQKRVQTSGVSDLGGAQLMSSRVLLRGSTALAVSRNPPDAQSLILNVMLPLVMNGTINTG